LATEPKRERWSLDGTVRECYGMRVDPLRRNNVGIRGSGAPPLMFAHGFGCDQNMWRLVAPAFEARHRTILFDHVGAGGADPGAFNTTRYATLQGYADDVLEICRAADLRQVVFVGHSVSAMIGVLAAISEPERFSKLVLVGPSPRYIDEDGYTGGFKRADIDALLESLDSNYLGWSNTFAPVIMGNPDRPELGSELVNSFCRTDPEHARHFAKVTFLSDNRSDLSRLRVPALILQCSDDVIASRAVGEYVHRALKDSQLVLMKATGHCPNLSAPQETIAAIREFL
jgi:sigma-B regulation protein RsbQ